MAAIALTGAQKSRMRGMGQQMEVSFRVGKEGLTPAGMVELRRQMAAHELVKIRLLGADRDQREALCVQVAESTGSTLVGTVGRTALFYTPAPEAAAAEGA